MDQARLGRSEAFVAYDTEHLEAYLESGDPTVSVRSTGTVAFEGSVAKCHQDLGANLLDGDVLVFEVSDDGSLKRATIVREKGNLSREELKSNAKEVAVSRFKELKGLVDLGCFERMARKLSKNRLDTRWVETWKQVDGKWIIKSRLTMRGFKDREQSLETFAGTASRAGQRIVNSEAAQHLDMVLFSFDVSQAFAKGLTFEEIARLSGTPLREVEVDLTQADVALLRRLPGWESFNRATETVKMLKPVYGLKDAPRAWRKRLHQVLSSWGMSQLLAEPELYVSHEGDKAMPGPQISSIDRRVASAKAAETESRPEPVDSWLKDRRAKLRCLLSTHVDDLKGLAKKEIALSLLGHLEKHFGTCKAEWSAFTHTGIAHVHSPGKVECHQRDYISSLKPMNLSGSRGKSEEDVVDDQLHASYMTLLGGAAWCVLTRADAAVFIQALQRRAHKPRYIDCKRLNVVVRFMQREPQSITYERIDGPLRLVVFSDSAFKAQDDEASGLALRSMVVLLTAETGKLTLRGRVHMLDFVVRRLKRVVRSTFAAELNALIDAIEAAFLIQLVLHQVQCGTGESPEQLLHRLEHGKLAPECDIFLDARSVFDALVSKDVSAPLESSLLIHIISIRDRLL